MRLGGPAHGIVTKIVYKTLPGGGGGQEWVGILVTGGGGARVGGWAVGGLFDMKCTLSVRHNYLKLKMII